jgi:hypothetical protein
MLVVAYVQRHGRDGCDSYDARVHKVFARALKCTFLVSSAVGFVSDRCRKLGVAKLPRCAQERDSVGFFLPSV